MSTKEDPDGPNSNGKVDTASTIPVQLPHTQSTPSRTSNSGSGEDTLRVSPQRPRGPNAPSVAAEHEHAAQWVAPSGSGQHTQAADALRGNAGVSQPSSAVRSLFQLFRKPSMASLISTSTTTQARGRPSPMWAPSDSPTKQKQPLNKGAPRGGGASVAGTTGGSMADSFYGGLDSLIPPGGDAQAANVLSPQHAKALNSEVATVVDAAAKFRTAIENMSQAAAEFGDALDQCSKAKGMDVSRVDADLQVAGGLHLLISNHIHLLGSAIGEKFEAPVERALEDYQRKVKARESEFKTALRSRILALRQAEAQSQRQSRRRNRNLVEYRHALLDLTSQIDDINRVKFEFLGDLRVLATDLAEQLHVSLASVATAEVEIFESIAHKGWSGGGLEDLMAICADPFESSGPPARLRHNGGRPAAREATTSSGTGRLDTPALALAPSDNASSSESASSPQMFSVLPSRSILPMTSQFTQQSESDDHSEDDTPRDPRRFADLSISSEIPTLKRVDTNHNDEDNDVSDANLSE